MIGRSRYAGPAVRDRPGRSTVAVAMETLTKAVSGRHTVSLPAREAEILSLGVLLMIVSDDLYKAAARQRADELEPEVVKRFEDAYGPDGRLILERMVKQMARNVEGDNSWSG